jgi:hypothetical protein
MSFITGYDVSCCCRHLLHLFHVKCSIFSTFHHFSNWDWAFYCDIHSLLRNCSIHGKIYSERTTAKNFVLSLRGTIEMPRESLGTLSGDLRNFQNFEFSEFSTIKYRHFGLSRPSQTNSVILITIKNIFFLADDFLLFLTSNVPYNFCNGAK